MIKHALNDGRKPRPPHGHTLPFHQGNGSSGLEENISQVCAKSADDTDEWGQRGNME
ncbi:hypothetical protein D3C78_1677440 [compost metagenome]